MASEHSDKIRIVQETVAGKEITYDLAFGGMMKVSALKKEC